MCSKSMLAERLMLQIKDIKCITNQYQLKKVIRKAMNRNWSNQKANPALKTKTGNK